MIQTNSLSQLASKLLSVAAITTLIAACSSDDTTKSIGPNKKTFSIPVELYSGATQLNTCDTQFAGASGLGANSQSGSITKFAMFVHDIKATDEYGDAINFTLDKNDYQAQGVAMVTMSCASPENANMAITGSYTSDEKIAGLSFKVGVPQSLNHQNPAEQASPLNYSDLQWSWAMGKRFFVLEGAFDPVVNSASFSLHVGSTGCSGDPAKDETVTCSKSNRAEIELTSINPNQQAIKIDIQALMGTNDFEENHSCHSFSGQFCKNTFPNLGINFDNGTANANSQNVFSVVDQ